MKKLSKLFSEHGVVHINSTLSNTFVTLTTSCGRVVAWASGGSVGFRGSRRSTSYAAQATGDKIGKMCLQQGFHHLLIQFQGVGYGKEAALRGLLQNDLKILKIEEKTRVPFNGCRASRKRRV